LHLKTDNKYNWFRVISVMVCLHFSMHSNGQSPSNLIKQNLLPGFKSIYLDSLYTIDKNSIRWMDLRGASVKINYEFNSRTGLLLLDSSTKDTLILSFRKMPSFLFKPFVKRPMSLIEPVLPKDPFAFDSKRDGLNLPEDNNLKTDGNISRGISAGNNQDLVVNSNLNLRLGGKIAGDVAITGVISDDNNPVQPEGNTQQLQDFDKVFIMLSKDSNNLIVGDFEMKAPGSYFMNYYKKSRGIHADYQRKSKENKVFYNIDAAISRGRFARNTIQGTEGNQGPYRLSGNNGETFIIIISGTEVVYLDGRRLSRGESRDYVINYNSGEVTFMPNQMITKFSRIVVEFQYSDRNYQRTVLKTGLGLQTKRALFEINYFNEQDNKNQNFQQSLDGYDSVRMLSAKQILANAGDSIENAFIPRVTVYPKFDNTKLLYRKLDTAGFKNIYVFTQNDESDTVFYEVVFSLVGANQGNYRQKTSTANGRVFEWVQPINGIPQGNYEPVELLIAPKRFQMMTVGVKRSFGNTETFVEGVYTNNNINTFSNLNKSNDDGFGLTGGLKNTTELKQGKNKLLLINQFRTEIVNKDFRFVERYRPVEFERNWNKQLSIPVANLTSNLPEILANYGVSLESKDKFVLQYKAGVYHRSKEFSGLNHQAFVSGNIKKTHLQSSFERMNNSIPTFNSVLKNDFLNYDGEISRKLKFGKAGVGGHYEKSKFTSTKDSLLSGTYSYNSGRLFIESSDTTDFTYGILAERRLDQLPYFGLLRSGTLADEINWKMGYVGKKGGRVNFNGSYRNLQYLDTLVIKGISERNALGRIESDLPLFKRALRLNSFYQIGTGQEQKREFTYLQVSDGNGIYIWNDYDSNKVQSLNEFEIASDYDRKRANFIKTSLPVQGFIKSRNIQFNQTVNLTAPQSWNKKKGIKLFLTRFSALVVYRSDRKTTTDEASEYLNPFVFNVTDLNLLSSNANLRSTFYINRNHPVWSADITRVNGQSRILLVNGFETRENSENIINSRLNLNRNWGTLLQWINGEKSFFSQLLLSRNYSYRFISCEPQLQFTSSNSNMGAALVGKYYKARAGEIESRNLEAGLEIRLSKAAKGSFNGNFRLVNIVFNGDAASPLGYELMRGLLPGKNYTWNFVYQQRLSSNIQMDISYDGRKSEQSQIIHIGRVMARYLF